VVSQSNRIQYFKRPLSIKERGTNDIAFLVCKRVDEDDPLGLNNFAKDKPAPHFKAVRGPHAVVKYATRAEFQPFDKDVEAFRSPPLRQALGIGPGLEDEIAWRIEDTSDYEVGL
jgi:hypothetical protein